MPRTNKTEVCRAVVVVSDLLERNACPYETFEGVLNQRDVKGLETLLEVAFRFLITCKAAGKRGRHRPKPHRN